MTPIPGCSWREDLFSCQGLQHDTETMYKQLQSNEKTDDSVRLNRICLILINVLVHVLRIKKLT